jgi:hypothetical protein
MDLHTIVFIFAFLVFGAIGCALARRRRRPASFLPFVVLVGVAIAGFFIGAGTSLVDVFGYGIDLNWAIVAVCLGGCVGLVVHNRRLHRLENA